MPDIYRSPLFTVKNMLKKGIIPYLVVDYSRNSLSVLQYRMGRFILGDASFEDCSIPLALGIIPESKVDNIILDSTRVTVDYNVITDEMFNELLGSLSVASDIVRSRLIEINNKKGTGFTEDDFETLIRISTKMRKDIEFWEL